VDNSTIPPISYGELLAEIIASNASTMFDSLPPQKRRGGVDLGFRENHLRDFISAGIKNGNVNLPTSCPRLLVETKLVPDLNPGRVDYCFVHENGLKKRTVVATCEAKGPVRKSFLDLSRFGRNWSRVFIEDIQKQLNRGRTQQDAEHYIALMLPFTESWVRNSSFGEIVRRATAAVPESVSSESACKEITLSNGLPLTVVVLQIKAA
jgi:hypothetical protein